MERTMKKLVVLALAVAGATYGETWARPTAAAFAAWHPSANDTSKYAPGPKPPLEIQSLIDATDAEHAVCQDFPYGTSIGDAACKRRDELMAEVERKGWCWGSASDVGADNRWMTCRRLSVLRRSNR